MKTGKVSNVEEENDSFTYYFETKNSKNGRVSQARSLVICTGMVRDLKLMTITRFTRPIKILTIL